MNSSLLSVNCRFLIRYKKLYQSKRCTELAACALYMTSFSTKTATPTLPVCFRTYRASHRTVPVCQEQLPRSATACDHIRLFPRSSLTVLGSRTFSGSLRNYSTKDISAYFYHSGLSLPQPSRTFCSASGDTDSYSSDDNDTTKKWPLYSVNVTTSHERWHEAPLGLEFITKYIDTRPDANSMVPTVLCIHGAPGSHRDFSTLLNLLASEGVRVIVPNFPGYDETVPVIPEDLEIFSHATDERTEFILNFMDSIGLSQVDILLGHSLGCAPLYVLGARSGGVVRSLVLVNPVPHEKYKIIQSRQWFFRSFPWVWDRKTLRPLIQVFLGMIKKNRGLFARWSARHFAISCLTTTGLMFPVLRSSAMEIMFKKIPFTYLWSENDHLFQPELCKLTGETLGVQTYTVYDEMGCIKEEGGDDVGDHYAKGIVFEKGTHMCHRKHPQIVTEAVMKQLKHIDHQRNVQLRTKVTSS